MIFKFCIFPKFFFWWGKVIKQQVLVEKAQFQIFLLDDQRDLSFRVSESNPRLIDLKWQKICVKRSRRVYV